MKRIISLGLTMVLLICTLAFPCYAAEPFTEGQGTEDSPYIIRTAEQLQQICAEGEAYFELGEDLDLTQQSWTPLGSYLDAFEGKLDGKGHSIRNMTISAEGSDMQGLFARIGLNGLVKNLVLENCSVTGQDNVGILAGMNSGTVENVELKGANTVTGRKAVGGLIGDNWTGTVTGCLATAGVTADAKAGVIAGDNSNGKQLANCAAFGSVTARENAGGLTGANAYGVVDSAYSVAAVQGDASTGGAIGETQPQTVANTYYGKETSGQTDAGKGEARPEAELRSSEFFAALNQNGAWKMGNDGFPVPKGTQAPDKSELQKAVTYAQGIDLTNMTEDSLAAFNKALANAEAALNDPMALQSDVDEAQRKLVEAIDGLTQKEPEPDDSSTSESTSDSTSDSTSSSTSDSTSEPNSNTGGGNVTPPPASQPSSSKNNGTGTGAKPSTQMRDELKRVVEYAKSLDMSKYFAEGQEAFQEALKNAEEALQNKNLTEKAAQVQVEKLRSAINELTLLPSKTALGDLIGQATLLKEADYTEESFASLSEALALAKKVYDKAEATPEEIEEARARLQQALDGLEEAADVVSSGSAAPSSVPAQTEQPGSNANGKTLAIAGIAILVLAILIVLLLLLKRRNQDNK